MKNDTFFAKLCSSFHFDLYQSDMEKISKFEWEGVIAWTILLSNNNILQTFDTKKSKGQAVDFDSQVFLRDRVNANCGVSKQDKIPFARSENDDVMK